MKDKKLKELFESSLLNEETKTVLQESWDAAVEAQRVELEAEYAGRLNEARDELFGQVGTLVEESIASEFQDVAEELAEARTLEVKYAEKLETFKEQYSEKVQEQIDALVKEAVGTEMSELKEDIDFARKHQFAVALVESFGETYEKMFGTGDVDVHKKLDEAQTELDTLRREKIIHGLLESVQGEKRSVVETILEGVATDKLEARFEQLRPVILAESDKGEAEGEKLTESDEGAEAPKGEVVLESEGQEGAGDQGKVTQIDSAVMQRLQRSLSRI